MTDSTRKKTRTREIILSGDQSDSDDPVVVGSPRRSLSARKKPPPQIDDHLETKKQIEDLRSKFGSNWLNADGENIVKEVFPHTSTTDDDLIRRRILIDELNDSSILSSTPKEGMASRLEITDDQLNSTGGDNYGTASERTVTAGGTTTTTTTTDEDTTTAPYESALSGGRTGEQITSDLTGLEFFQSQQSMDEDEPEPNEVEYHAEMLKTARAERGTNVLLVVSDLSVKEKNPVTKELLMRWGLTVLESCERPNERNVISIHFNTMRSNKRERFYLMEDGKSCQELTSCLREILASRDWDEFNQAVFRCAKCTTQFCMDKHNEKAKGEWTGSILRVGSGVEGNNKCLSLCLSPDSQVSRVRKLLCDRNKRDQQQQ